MHLDLIDLSGTEKLGFALSALAQAGDIILLAGDLGAGKTTLTQFIGRGLEVPSSCYITSPTFSLLHEYPGRLPLYHLDLYRLSGEEEIEDLGLLDYLYGEGICVIEWPDRLGTLLPKEHLEIVLHHVTDGRREAELTFHGPNWQLRKRRLAEMLQEYRG